MAPVSPEPPDKSIAKPQPIGRTADEQRFNAVFTPRAGENPVLTAFKMRNLYKKAIGDGRHEVTCPWVDEHTDKLDTGAAYFEPGDAFPIGGFCCQHSHKDKYRIQQVLEKFDLSTAEARNRALIRIMPGEMNAIQKASERLLADRGDLYQAGGLIVSVSSDKETGDAKIIPVGESALTLALSSVCDWEKYDGRKGAWVRTDPPPRNVGLLYRADQYDHLPVLLGVARQPYFDPKSGELVTKSGYNEKSQRLGAFDTGRFNLPGPTREAAEDALTRLQDLIGEFHFATDFDRSAALSAILTATVRPSLNCQSAFNRDPLSARKRDPLGVA